MGKTPSAPYQPFLDDLEKLHQQTGPWQMVLFTGDLVQKGTQDEFRDMQQEVLARLWEKLDERSDDPGERRRARGAYRSQPPLPCH